MCRARSSCSATQGAGASLRAIGEAIGVSQMPATAGTTFARATVAVECIRAHEARTYECPASEEVSRVGDDGAKRRAETAIPGLVELYATLTTDALQAQRQIR